MGKVGGVAWYLLVAISHTPVFSLSSPGMMGVLDVPGRQELSSAKTYTTHECLFKEERRLFKSIANHLVELELPGSYFLWCSCRLIWRNHPHRFPVEYCHRKPHFIYSTHIKEFNAKETRGIATRQHSLRLVRDARRRTYYVIQPLLVVVHDINVKKRTGIEESKCDYQERKEIESSCAEDSVCRSHPFSNKNFRLGQNDSGFFHFPY